MVPVLFHILQHSELWTFEIERVTEREALWMPLTWLRFPKMPLKNLLKSILDAFLIAGQLSKLLRSSPSYACNVVFGPHQLPTPSPASACSWLRNLRIWSFFSFALTVNYSRSSSEIYAPVNWSVYFDKQDDVAIPESNDVSFFCKIGIPISLRVFVTFFFLFQILMFLLRANLIFQSIQVFHVYTAGTEGPVVFCLHGGGYSGYAYCLFIVSFIH
jgi:hypothetical protein